MRRAHHLAHTRALRHKAAKTREEIQMAEPVSRLRTPIVRAEMERRWALVREEMKEAGVDAIISQAANNLTGTAGHYRWLTGLSVASSYLQAVVIPREGPFTLVMHGDHEAVAELGDKDPAFPNIGRRVTSWGFPGVHYCAPYEGEMLAKEVKKGGYRKLGIVQPNTWYAGFYNSFMDALGRPAVVDMTTRIDRHKAIKSDEEIRLLRVAAKMQDDILDEIRNHIRPGMFDYEIMSKGHHLGMLAGSGPVVEDEHHYGLSFIAINPAIVMPGGEYPARVAELRRLISQSRPAAGFDNVRMPGANSQAAHRAALHAGANAMINVDDTVYKAIQEIR